MVLTSSQVRLPSAASNGHAVEGPSTIHISNKEKGNGLETAICDSRLGGFRNCNGVLQQRIGCDTRAMPNSLRCHL